MRTACATALAVGLVLVALGCGWVHFAGLRFDAAHTSASSPQPTHGSIHADHASADRGLAPRCSKLLATTALPAQAASLAGLGLVVALGVAAGTWAPRVATAGRGPPVLPGPVISGRDLLTRFGIARR
ncbi:hypothetical protein [Mycobacterium sp.]|uniref:hypothetical protein n=1 Tax=Mycobacterium sp. TaxID=1785 RepID=UPI0026003BB2|nr:hypothetical protein [Mycobacterium sp.]